MDMTDAPYYPGGGVNVDSPEWENPHFVKRLSEKDLKEVIAAFKKAKRNFMTVLYPALESITKK